MLVVAEINFGVYPFLVFLKLTFHLQHTEIGCTWLHSTVL